MSRSMKKGPFVDPKLAEKVRRQKDQGGREPIKTWARACTIVPDFVGHTFLVHNGKAFLRVYVTEELVGHKLGEFSPTRTFRGHSGGAGSAAKAAAAAKAPAPAKQP
ncbi:MAG: 30S ribosomal protein S19 [Planctomycetota bacterium]|nr:30S ribosomal protein S19 [Planctomycetota bacterium]